MVFFFMLSTICEVANTTLMSMGDRDYLMIRIMLISPYMNFLERLYTRLRQIWFIFTIMFLRVLNEEAEGHIVIVTTGIFAMAKRIAKDVLVLSNGEINEVTYEMIDIPEIKKAIFDILGELEE